MTVHPSPFSRPRRLGLQLALAALGALPVHALAEGPALSNVPPPPAIEAPPAPPRDLPQPEVSVQANVATTAPTPQPPAAAPVDGQWVYTQQYGWVWMPYAPSYTYVPVQGNPVMYVYGPTFGWSWVAAPWVFNYGPVPYWGVHGRVYFAWYSHPWFVQRPYHPVYVAPRPVYHRDYHYHGAARHNVHVHEHHH
ncbi:MAG TPA: hypothetical protein VJV78_14890 [Polyangiales bacterium]|nr:hypothetical protein [Polyangiales bacterium]